MTKNFRRVLLITLIILISVNTSHAVTKGQFLGRLLEARGLNWSESPEYQAYNPAAFILRTGYVTDTVDNLNANVTRLEALRWCIESLGLSFEAKLLADYPTGFKDVRNLTPFEKGCLVIASNMKPAIFTKADKFRPSSNLSDKEFRIIMDRVREASRGFTLDIIRNPIAGLRVFIHREGVPTGVPEWRAYLDGIRTRPAAEAFKNSLKPEGIESTITSYNYAYGVRTQKLEDYNKVRRLEVIAKSRGLELTAMPLMTNTDTSIVPRFWVILRIDPSYWKLSPMTAENGPQALSTLMKICDDNQAKAAINAGFFAVINSDKGYPIGALKIHGRFIGQPYDGRGCLAWNDNDEAVFSIGYSEELANWYDMSNIIQAGPLLLNEGVAVNYDEGFQNAFISARHPRSVVGLNREGAWVFMIIDGRNGMHSSGATISELTEILRRQGITHALNLDGGGSTEIIIDGRIYNWPSDTHERKISYALGVVPIN